MKSFRKQFLSIFAISLVATLLLCPGNYSVPGGIRDNFSPVEVQAEEPTITDTQKGVALLMTILFAQGLRFVGDWDTVVEPGIEKLWNDFTTATGNAVTLPMIVAGSSLALGYIRTSNTVNNAIANFTAWYKQTFSQPTTGDVSIPVGSGETSFYTFDQCVLALRRSNGRYTKFNASVAGPRLILLGDGVTCHSLFAVYTSPFTYGGELSNGTGCSVSLFANADVYVVGGVNYYVGANSISAQYSTLSDVVIPSAVWNASIGHGNSIRNAENAIYYTYGDGAVIGDISMTGESLELRDGYQLEQDQAKLYDISALTALVAELALTLDNIEDLVRDIPLIYDTPWSLDYPDDPTYVDTPDDTIPWVTVPDSVIPSEVPEYVPTTPGDTDSYKILGLERVFPFSIPFDLYYLTQIFVATPETPHFTYAIMNPATNQLLTQEFDLHWFDTLAAVIRTGETVAFLIFLIFVTRGLIRS